MALSSRSSEAPEVGSLKGQEEVFAQNQRFRWAKRGLPTSLRVKLYLGSALRCLVQMEPIISTTTPDEDPLGAAVQTVPAIETTRISYQPPQRITFMFPGHKAFELVHADDRGGPRNTAVSSQKGVETNASGGLASETCRRPVVIGAILGPECAVSPHLDGENKAPGVTTRESRRSSVTSSCRFSGF